jgi:hypothetical protein
VKLRKLTLLRSRLEWSWFAARLRRAVGLKGASTFLSRKLQNPGDEGDGEKDFSLLAPTGVEVRGRLRPQTMAEREVGRPTSVGQISPRQAPEIPPRPGKNQGSLSGHVGSGG